METTLRALASRPSLTRPYVGGEAARRRRHHRGGARVQSRLARDDDRRRLDHVPLHAGRRVGAGRREAHLEKGISSSEDPAGRPLQRRDAIHVHHQHRRDQAARVSRQVVRVERQQQVARAHLVTRLDARLETLAVEPHRVQPDVDEDLEPRRRKGERVAGAMHVKDARIAGREEPLVERIERETVARQPSRKRRIGHLLERHDHAGQWRQQGQAVQAVGWGGGA